MRTLVLSSVFALAVAGCGETSPARNVVNALRAPEIPEAAANPSLVDYHPDLQVAIDEMEHHPSGLLWHDDSVGVGNDSLNVDMTAVVHYTGWLPDGTQFDTSREGGQPFAFRVGAGEVIDAWDLGLIGMRVGGKRKLIVPPELGYGVAAYGPLPANAILVFEVELLEIRP